MTPDVNVLFAASRSDHPHLAVALSWLQRTMPGIDSGTALALMPMVLTSFLRLVNSPKVFKTRRLLKSLFGSSTRYSMPAHTCPTQARVATIASTLSRTAIGRQQPS